MTDPYGTLGIKAGATDDEIRSAYRRLVKEFHPDVAPASAPKDQFLAIQEAYEVLSDTDRRRAYDQMQALKNRVAPPTTTERVKTASYGNRTVEEPGQIRVQPRVNIAPQVTELQNLVRRAKLPEAEAFALQLIEIEAQHPVPYAVLGDIMIAQGKRNKATEYYAFAMQLAPGEQTYVRKYEDSLKGVTTAVRDKSQRVVYEEVAGNPIGLSVGVGVIAVCAAYVVIGQNTPMFPQFALLNSWSLGLMVMLLIGGVALGAGLAISRHIDEFFLSQGSAVATISPSIILAGFAILNFWLAAVVYFLAGASQRAYNKSTSRVVGGVAATTIFFTIASQVAGLQAIQTFLWGGNLIYIGALAGWIGGSAFRD